MPRQGQYLLRVDAAAHRRGPRRRRLQPQESRGLLPPVRKEGGKNRRRFRLHLQQLQGGQEMLLGYLRPGA
jgi:hypothetical protein